MTREPRTLASLRFVIHLAFIHDFTDFAASCAKNEAAIETLGGVLEGSNRPLVDFREARFPPGVIELDLRAVMSSVEIIVPPGLPVETEGSAILGVFDDVQRVLQTADPDAPRLEIRGSAFMSAVEIRMRLPGETERAHRLRERRDLRAARRQLRS